MCPRQHALTRHTGNKHSINLASKAVSLIKSKDSSDNSPKQICRMFDMIANGEPGSAMAELFASMARFLMKATQSFNPIEDKLQDIAAGNIVILHALCTYSLHISLASKVALRIFGTKPSPIGVRFDCILAKVYAFQVVINAYNTFLNRGQLDCTFCTFRESCSSGVGIGHKSTLRLASTQSRASRYMYPGCASRQPCCCTAMQTTDGACKSPPSNCRIRQ